MLALLGIAVVVAGFALRLNPLLVVAGAALTAGLAAGLDPVAVVSVFGKAFNDNRYVSATWLVVAAIGLLEREGLQERARILASRIAQATTGRLLLVYFLVRQATAALGLTSLGGHAQMVRPLIAPMAEAAGEKSVGALDEGERQAIRAHAAATDNIALFFGEDIFIAISSILLMKGFLAQSGIEVEPFHLSMWAIPTALAAMLIHGLRLIRLDATLARRHGGRP